MCRLPNTPLHFSPSPHHCSAGRLGARPEEDCGHHRLPHLKAQLHPVQVRAPSLALHRRLLHQYQVSGPLLVACCSAHVDSEKIAST